MPREWFDNQMAINLLQQKLNHLNFVAITILIVAVAYLVWRTWPKA